ncbi:MAG: sporulation integral membrane protein YtvI [Lachnospiraceae bacterium]
MKNSTKYLKIMINILLPIFGVFVVFFLCPKILVFFLPFVIGWLISLVANPLVKFLERRLKIVRKHGSAIIIVLVIVGVAAAVYAIVAKFVGEIGKLVLMLPELYIGAQADYSNIVQNFSDLYAKLPMGLQSTITEITSDIGSYASSFIKGIGTPTMEKAGNVAQNLPAILIGTIVAFLAAYFFIADRVKIVKLYETYFPVKLKEKIMEITSELKQVVGGYFKAQFKIMVVVYIMVVIGLLILRVDFSFLIALLVAFLDMLPFFGTGTILVPWAILKVLTGNYKLAIGLVILYALTQLVRQVIQPKILGDSIGMNPLLALFFMYLGFKFSGVLGMIFAVPIGMILINLCRTGIFDNFLKAIRMALNDFNEFRKW